MEANITWDESVTERIIEEVSGFSIELVGDPTAPEHGSAYLQKSLSTCRAYINRTLYYLQSITRALRTVRMDVRQHELDIDFKVQEQLSDSPIVRQQPSIEDRKALAMSTLRTEQEELAKLRIRSIDLEETQKILKMRYGDLQRTMSDIRLQRQIVKDDMEAWEGSKDGGYVAPHRQKDKTVEGGMQAPVRPRLDPQDLLDPSRRPADLPEPVDGAHAAQIASFFNSSPDPVILSAREDDRPEVPSKEEEAPAPVAKTVSYADLLSDD